MNGEQLISLVRIALQFGGGLLVSRGLIDDATMTAVGGALITLVGAGWSLYARRNTGLVASAATVPGVSTITTTSSKLANAVPSDKVRVGA